MAPLDSATAQQDTLILVDEQLRGEKLTVDSADKKLPLGRRILFILVTSFVLWTGIYFTVSSVFKRAMEPISPANSALQTEP